MAKEEAMEETRRNAVRYGKMFGAGTIVLLTLGIWALCNDALPLWANIVLANEGICGALICFFGFMVMFFSVASIDNDISWRRKP